jgi:hypothetical protein
MRGGHTAGVKMGIRPFSILNSQFSIFTSELMRLRRTLMHENDRRYRLSAIGYFRIRVRTL